MIPECYSHGPDSPLRRVDCLSAYQVAESDTQRKSPLLLLFDFHEQWQGKAPSSWYKVVSAASKPPIKAPLYIFPL